MDEFLQDFVDEAKMHIEKTEAVFLDTESFVKNDETINDVFRAIHSIKGTAGFFQLKTIVALSHAMENVLGQIRSKHISFTEEVLDALLVCNDLLKHMIFHVEESETTDISKELKLLEDILQGVSSGDLPAKKSEEKAKAKQNAPTQKVQEKSVDKQKEQENSKNLIANASNHGTRDEKASFVMPKVEHESSLSIYHKNIPSVATAASIQVAEKFYDVLGKLAKRGHKIYKIVLLYDEKLQNYYKNMGVLFDVLKEIGEIIDCFTDIEPSHDLEEVFKLLENNKTKSTIRLELLVTSVLEYDLFCESVFLPANCVLQIPSDPFLKKIIADETKKEDATQNILRQDESIRVSVTLLEKLMALSGEMVLARNQLLTAYQNKKTEQSEMSRILQNIDHLTSRMQEEIMMTRMQPVGNIFNKFPRVIREISKSIKKEIALYIEGKDIELDKTMIEGLSDPLIHLVRNAADHGIEEPKVRAALGKQERGSITLKAYHKSGLVAIEIADDGAGIDVVAVKNKAVAKGFYTREQADQLSDTEAYKLIFLPGFSTADKISDISGRGVGMDVVRSNVEKLGGTVEIVSKQGSGTIITLLLPRTLAIMQSLIVGVSGQRFAIPQTAIVHVVSLREEELNKKLERIREFKEYRLRGKLLPVIGLDEVLGIQQTEVLPTKIVVIRVMKKEIGFLVHQVFDTEETLVKPLPRSLQQCIVYSGVTIMGDGKISLILDPEGIVQKSNISFAEKNLMKNDDVIDRQKVMLEHQNMMLFTCSGPELYAIDLNMVSRVETIHVSDIEIIGNEKYVKIRGKTLRVIRPESYLPVQKQDYQSETLTVIIPNLVKHPLGILVDTVIDNIKAHFELDTEQIVAPGVFGTIIHQNRIILILNIYELFEMADPINHPKMQKEIDISKRVLIVEDTPFFQHIEQKYLEDAGCTVTVAENGKEALGILKDKHFDLIVSDLIMPVMGGLEFIQHVRKDVKLRNIPVVAVTSMTSDNYYNKAVEYGFDAFENKLNKETLLRTIDNILKSKKGGGLQ